jgi:pimeloyl-ACP methyl ester carboxylesterase
MMERTRLETVRSLLEGAKNMETTVNGITLHYREQGQGEPLVLLHGFPLDGSMWDGQLASLSDRFRVIAPDLRGCGRSDAVERTSMDEMADDVAALLAGLGIERAIVGGFSMGGYVAFALLRRHPQLVRGLILSNTKEQPDTGEGKAGRAAMARSIREQGAAAAETAMAPKLLSPAAPEALRRQLQRVMLAQRPQGLIACVLAMAERPDSSPLLAAVRMPALVIGSDGDAIIPLAVSEATAAAIPGAVLRRVVGAAHASNVEQPDAWNGFVRDWHAASTFDR